MEAVLEVRRVYTSARAYALEARLRWRGIDDVTGLPWPDDWRPTKEDDDDRVFNEALMREVRMMEAAKYGTRLPRASADVAPSLPSQSTALNAGLKRGCAVKGGAAVQPDRENSQVQQAWKRLRLGPGPMRAVRSEARAHPVEHAATWRLGIGDRLARHVPVWRRHVSRRSGVRTRSGAQDDEALQRVRDRWWVARRGVRKHRWRVGGEWGSWSVDCVEARPTRSRHSAWDAELVVLRPPRVRGRRGLAEESDEGG